MLYSKLVGKHLGILLLVGATFLWSCNDSDSASVATKPPNSPEPTSDRVQPDTDLDTDIFAEDSVSRSTGQTETDTTTSIALLEGKWSPSFYIDPDGNAVDLSGMPEAERAEFRWEFTPEGRVFSGEREGIFDVEGDTISLENLASGEVTQFQFSVSENELTLISDTNATLKLDRRSE